MEDQRHEDAPPANNRAVKLPQFWTANPRAWFASAEGAFQRTRFWRTPTRSCAAACWLRIS
jgi:hypothetical protein